MKKLFVFITVTVVAAFLVSGCAGEPKTYTEPGQVINIGADQEFVIALDSNPTTGYQWQESHDETALQFLGKTYEQGERAKKGTVGAGGVAYFRFKALKKGKTEVTMVYKRAWEEEFAEQKVFTVNIK